MNWVRYTQLNKLGVSTSLPKFFGLSLPILVCSALLMTFAIWAMFLPAEVDPRGGGGAMGASHHQP